MGSRCAAVLATALLAVLLSACAGEPGNDQAGETDPTDTPSLSPVTPTPTPPASPPSPPPTGSPPVVPPTGEPSGRPGLTTLTGEVFAGVEPGCVLLRTSSGDYLLFGEAANEAEMGSTVTVRGQVRANMASTCQQGTPFEVAEVLD